MNSYDYLLRVNEFDKLPDTPMNEWMDYLKTGKVNEDTRTPGLQRVREKLRVLNMTEAERRAYFRHLDLLMQQNDAYDTAVSKGMAEGLEIGQAKGFEIGRAKGFEIGQAKGIEIGREKGRAEGEELERRKSIRTMLTFGIPAEKIAEKYGLSATEIKRICESD